MVVLNRTVSYYPARQLVTLEPEQRQVQTMVADLGLKKGKAVSTPRVALSEEQVWEDELSEPLSLSETIVFRSVTVRAAYLSQDRVEISEAVKCGQDYTKTILITSNTSNPNFKSQGKES